MSAIAYAHLDRDDRGAARIAGTTTKVIEVALDYLAHRWDAEEIHRQHPHLSLGQIHSALAYYFDHQGELDQEIAGQLAEIERFKQQSGPSLALAKAKAAGHLP